MYYELAQLIILFFVIFDPPASFAVFMSSTGAMTRSEKKRTASYAILVAASLSMAVLLFGQGLLNLFNTSLDTFRVAGGIVLILLGIKMATGMSFTSIERVKKDSTRA